MNKWQCIWANAICKCFQRLVSNSISNNFTCELDKIGETGVTIILCCGHFDDGWVVVKSCALAVAFMKIKEIC